MHQLNYIYMILLRIIYKNLIHIYNYIYDKYMIMHNVDMIKYIYPDTRGNRTHVRAYV